MQWSTNVLLCPPKGSLAGPLSLEKIQAVVEAKMAAKKAELFSRYLNESTESKKTTVSLSAIQAELEYYGVTDLFGKKEKNPRVTRSGSHLDALGWALEFFFGFQLASESWKTKVPLKKRQKRHRLQNYFDSDGCGRYLIVHLSS